MYRYLTDSQLGKQQQQTLYQTPRQMTAADYNIGKTQPTHTFTRR